MAENPFEIPQQMRDLADQNIKQAHAAYEQLTDFVSPPSRRSRFLLHSSPQRFT